MSERDEIAGSPAIQKLIAERAYQLWENQGRPNGSDLIHWRQAEAEILDCLKHNFDPYRTTRDR